MGKRQRAPQAEGEQGVGTVAEGGNGVTARASNPCAGSGAYQKGFGEPLKE